MGFKRRKVQLQNIRNWLSSQRKRRKSKNQIWVRVWKIKKSLWEQDGWTQRSCIRIEETNLRSRDWTENENAWGWYLNRSKSKGRKGKNNWRNAKDKTKTLSAKRTWS